MDFPITTSALLARMEACLLLQTEMSTFRSSIQRKRGRPRLRDLITKTGARESRRSLIFGMQTYCQFLCRWYCTLGMEIAAAFGQACRYMPAVCRMKRRPRGAAICSALFRAYSRSEL